jgi:hypothetical protein
VRQGSTEVLTQDYAKGVHLHERFDRDRAAQAIREVVPWLKTDTADDLVQFFERYRAHCKHQSRMADWWERRVVE